MDAPVWSNDLLYLKEMIYTIIITVGMIWVCFYFTRKADRRRAARVAHGLPPTKGLAATKQSPAKPTRPRT
jgi:hypothetical protein